MTVFEYRPADGPQPAARSSTAACCWARPTRPASTSRCPTGRYFADRLDDIDAVVLTHGHEDHIGALPYLLRERRDIPVIGSRLTLALVVAKLDQHRIANADLRTVTRGRAASTVGPWDLEFFAVNHSIPDALAVAIQAGGQTVLHTGDFKMDQTPLDGRLTDLPGFSRPGRRGRRPAAVRLDQRRGRAGSSRPSATSARSSPTSSPRRRAASSSPASPRTCTASSR